MYRKLYHSDDAHFGAGTLPTDALDFQLLLHIN